MVNPSQVNPRMVKGTVNYIKRLDEPLYLYSGMEPPGGKPETNHALEAHEVDIVNIRDLRDGTNVDVEGFELVQFTPDIEDIYDSGQRAVAFDPVISDLVKRRTGAIEARVFDPFLRGEEAQRRAPGSITAPAGAAHVDYTEESGPYWFDKILGEDAARLRGRRFAVINFWRPITGPLNDHPLALCDARTVAARDLMVSKSYSRIGKEGLRTGQGELSVTETYYTAYNASHRWYYVPDMLTSEALLLKNYDSDKHSVARFSPHCAFKDPTAPADVLPRASIEVRVLTVW